MLRYGPDVGPICSGGDQLVQTSACANAIQGGIGISRVVLIDRVDRDAGEVEFLDVGHALGNRRVQGAEGFILEWFHQMALLTRAEAKRDRRQARARLIELIERGEHLPELKLAAGKGANIKTAVGGGQGAHEGINLCLGSPAMANIRGAVEEDVGVKEPGSADEGAGAERGLDLLGTEFCLGFETGEDLEDDFRQGEGSVGGGRQHMCLVGSGYVCSTGGVGGQAMMMQIIRRQRTKIEETTEEGLTRTVQRAGAELTRLGCFGNRTSSTTKTEFCSRDSLANNCGTSVRRIRKRKKKGARERKGLIWV